MAKITFEDGTVVNFDGTPTPKDVEEVAKQLNLKKKTFNEKLGEFGSQAGRTIFRTAETISGLGQKTLGRLVGAYDKKTGPTTLSSLGLGELSRKPITKSERAGEIFGQAAQFMTPVGAEKLTALGLSKLPKLVKGAKIAKTTVKSLVGGAEFSGKTAAMGGTKEEIKTAGILGVATLPALQVAGKALKVGAKTIKFGTSQLSGLSPRTIEQVVQNPKFFSKEAMEAITRESLGKEVKLGILKKIEEFSKTGEGYNQIRELNKVVTVPKSTYTNSLSKYGLKLNNEGLLTKTAESKPFKSGELNQIEEFLSQYGLVNHTPNSALNAREALSELAKFDTAKSTNLASWAKTMRADLNKVLHDEKLGIPGLKQLDDVYSSEVKILKEIKSDYLKKGTNEFKDNALTKIANLTKEGRQSILQRLKDIVPNIEQNVNILRAIEDIKSAGGLKVGTYVRGGVAATGLATGNPAALLGAILSQPQILIPILRTYGKFTLSSKAFIEALINKLNKGGDLLIQEQKFIDKAINGYSKELVERVKNIKPGLSIQDVSKQPLKAKGEIIKSTKDTTNPLNFKTVEDYVKARTKPHYINIEDIKSSLDADTYSSLRDTPRNQNINLLNEYKSKISKIEKSPVGREITKPISIQFNVDGGDGYRILDGNHRYLQALKNGDKKILVKFETFKGTSQESKNIFKEKTKSQLISEWNKAHKLKSSSQSTPKTPLKSSTDNLINEAKKYKSAEEFYNNYTAKHLMDLSNPKKHRWGRLLEDGVNEDTGLYENLKIIVDEYANSVPAELKRGNVPLVKSENDIVTLYRGTTKNQKEILPGDFVSFSKEYAKSHNQGENILSIKVPAKDVVWQGNDMTEWIYSPEKIRGKKYSGGLKDIWEKANK